MGRGAIPLEERAGDSCSGGIRVYTDSVVVATIQAGRRRHSAVQSRDTTNCGRFNSVPAFPERFFRNLHFLPADLVGTCSTRRPLLLLSLELLCPGRTVEVDNVAGSSPSMGTVPKAPALNNWHYLLARPSARYLPEGWLRRLGGTTRF